MIRDSGKFTERNKGVSMITLVITIVVVIILAAIALKSSLDPAKETTVADYRNELKTIELEVTNARMKNQTDGIGEDIKEDGFYKVYIENPPAGFVSFGSGDYYGYVVNLDKIGDDKSKHGKDYELYKDSASQSQQLVFGSKGINNDVYVYDATGKVYYAKGLYVEGGVYFSDSYTMDGPTIKVSRTPIEDEEGNVSSVKLSIELVPVEDGADLSLRVDNVLQTPKANGTYEYIATKNKIYNVSAEEGTQRSAIKNVPVTEIKEKDYIITYQLNYDNKTETQTKYGSSTVRLKGFRRDGYILAGFSKSPGSLEISFLPGAIYDENKDITLYAIWKVGVAKEYTIVFNANGGVGGPDTITKLQGQVAIIPEEIPTRTGYTFVGWSKSSTNSNIQYAPNDVCAEDADLILYAVWSIGETEVIIEVNPAGAGTTVGSGLKKENDMVYITAIAEGGYQFDKWTVKTGSASVVIQSPYADTTKFTMPAGRVMLVANFKESSFDYTIKYDSNGGTNAPMEQYKKHNESVRLSSNTPRRSGYEFEGWATSAASNVVEYRPEDLYSENKSVILYAVWSKNTTKYTLTFDANGGTDAPEPITRLSNSIITIPAQVPKRSNLTFVGWNENKNSKEATYVRNSEFILERDTTLYAIWLDTDKPVVNITAKEENDGLVLMGNATDNGGITAYAWSNDLYNDSMSSLIPWENVSERLEISIRKDVIRAGMHYFYVKDRDDNVAYSSIEVYKLDFKSEGAILETKYKASSYAASISTLEPKRTKYVFKNWQAESDGNSYVSGDSYLQNKNEVFNATWYEAVAWIPSQNEYFISANDAAKTIAPGQASYELIKLLKDDTTPLEITDGQKISLDTETFKMDVNGIAITVQDGAYFKFINGAVDASEYAFRNLGTSELLSGTFSGRYGISNAGKVTVGDKSKTFNKDSIKISATSSSYIKQSTGAILDFQNGSFIDVSSAVPENVITFRDGFVYRAIVKTGSVITTMTEKITVTPSVTVGTEGNALERAITVTSAITARDNSSKIEYKINEGNWTEGSNITQIRDNCTISIRTVDSDGVAAETTISITDIKELVVHFDANNGTVSKATQNIKYKRPYNFYGDLPTPNRQYYIFKGWYTARDGGTLVENTTQVDRTDDHTLYARWEGITLTVTFDPNGTMSSVSPTSKSVVYNDTYGTLPEPTRTGYGFSGWYTSPTGGTKKTSSTVVNISSNETLYAHWTANTNTPYVVHHMVQNANDSGYTLDSTENQTGTTDSTLTLANLKKTITGATYVKGLLSNNPSGTGITTTTIAQDGSRVIYLFYTRNTYALTLNKNEHIASVTGAGTYKYGQSVSINATLGSADGYTYSWTNWTSSNTTLLPNQTNKNATITMPNGPITLTANASRTPNPNTAYTVYHYIENANNTNYTLQETENKTGQTDSPLTLANLKKTYTGTTYSKGTITEGGTATLTTTILGDGSRKIYLYYTRNTFALTLNKNEYISSVTGAGTYKYGQSVSISASLGSQAGYTYSWTNWTSSNTTLLANQASQSTTITMPNGAVTLTANGSRTPNPNTAYTVYHYIENANNTNYTLQETENKTGQTDSPLTLANLKKTYTGMTYSYGAITSGGTATTTTTILGDGSRKIYLYYTRNKYTLTLNKNEYISSVTGAGTYKYGQSVSISASLGSQAGYTYSWTNWTSSSTSLLANQANQNATFTMPNGAVTLTANGSRTPNPDTAYVVYHYLENANNTNYTLQETENKTGTTDSTLTLANLKKTYTGMTYSYGAITSGGTATTTTTILGDGSRKIYLYYTRNTYALTLSKNTYIASVTGAGTYKYGQSVSINATLGSQVGYTYSWTNWTSSNTSLLANQANQNATFTMPNGAVTLTANGSRTPNPTTAYTVYHYLENANNTSYTLQETENKTGQTDSSLTLANLKKTYTGMTYSYGAITSGGKPTTTTTILGDGSRKIYLYYTRNTYALTLNKNTYIASVTGAGTYKYGQSVSISASLGSQVGYTYSWTNWTSSSTTLLANQANQNATFTMPNGAVTLTANGSRTPNPTTAYVVYHYLENANNTGYTLQETENKTGQTDSSLTLANLKKTYTGMTYSYGAITSGGKPTTTTTILGDGSRKIYLYYTRNTYDLSLSKNTYIASVTGAGTYKYGQTVSINATLGSQAGYTYTWTNWSSSNTTLLQNQVNQTATFTMPNGSFTLTANGSRTPNEFTAYTVYHYLENANSTNYTLQETENKTGTTDSTLTLANLKKTYTGMTYSYGAITSGGSATTTTTILGDGSRKIYLYYTRNTYQLSLGKNSYIASVTGAGTYKYGQSVSISATLGSATGYEYTWTNWTSSNTALLANQTSQNTTITMPAGEVTLTANATRTALNVIVHFDANGGSCSTSTKTVRIGSTYGTLPTPTHSDSNYRFRGWYFSGDLIESGTTVTQTTDHTLVASWSDGMCYGSRNHFVSRDGPYTLNYTLRHYYGKTGSNVCSNETSFYNEVWECMDCYHRETYKVCPTCGYISPQNFDVYYNDYEWTSPHVFDDSPYD